VFAGPNGGPICGAATSTSWSGGRKPHERSAYPGLHFHGLRHSGNTLAARTKASLRDLMARMGHDSTNAAIIYLHATAEADRQIAGL
jgi:integrase